MHNSTNSIWRFISSLTSHAMLAICLVLTLTGCQSGADLPVQSEGATKTSLPQTAPETGGTVRPVTQTSLPVNASLLAFDPAIQSVEDLLGLPIRKFFDESYKLLLLRSPQKVTELGLAHQLGMRNDQLDDLSDEGLRSTQGLESDILDLLKGYDSSEMSETDRISYDVYTWYLETQVRGHPCAEYKYELTNFIGSYQFNLEQLLTELHPLETAEDAEDYLARLEGVGTQVNGLLDSLRHRAEAGILPTRYMLQAARQDLQERLGSTSHEARAIEPGRLNVYTHFIAAVAGMPGLSDQRKAELIQRATQATQDSLIPAYLQLTGFIDEYEASANEDAGLWKFPQGETCYQWLLQRETSSDMTAEEIHTLGLSEVERLRTEIQQILAGLPYQKDLSLNERLRMAQGDAGYIDLSTSQGKDELAQSYSRLLEQMEGNLNAYFIDLPDQKLEVEVDENCGAAYYVPGSLDGKRLGVFHSCVGGGWMPRSSMKTIAYHEGNPGHHFQIALSRQLDLPLFRHDIPLSGYVEGWALYAERLAWEMGMYQDDTQGNLARLQYELLRAARLVVDSGIHAKKWTRTQAQSYLNMTLGGFEYEADRYVALPAQATSYKVGMLKLLALRKMAEDALGEQFDLSEFHQVILGSGSLPLESLEEQVEKYIRDKQGGK